MGLELAAKEVMYYLDHPVEFVKQWIGATPTEQQARVLSELPRSTQVAVKSGHGIGKTALEAWTILWFLTLHPFARVPCTAPTHHQLEDILWPELRYWLDKSLIKELFTWQKSRLEFSGKEDTWFAIARSAKVPENLQGFHGQHILFVIDEASGVPQSIMEVVEGALTNEGARLFMAGNPTKLSGTFFDAFHRMRTSYKTFTFSCLESSIVGKGYAERIASRYGVESDVYRVRVLGEFPLGEVDTFIRLDQVEAAVVREADPSGSVAIGVDVARYGDDESVIIWREGLVVHKPEGHYNCDGPTLAGYVMKVVRGIRAAGHRGTIEVRIDETGLGASPYDFLAREAAEHDLHVIPINFGWAGDTEYADVVAKMWGRVKELLATLQLPEDDDLTAQLVVRKYKIQPNGKVKLEAKEDMKKRGIMSPDRADALALCLSDLYPAGVTRRPAAGGRAMAAVQALSGRDDEIEPVTR